MRSSFEGVASRAPLRCRVPVLDGTGALVTGSAMGNRFLYTGREWIAEAGLYDYRNRVYSAQLGRFLQADPILFDGEDINIYRYVGNNAVNWIDSDGLSSDEYVPDKSGKHGGPHVDRYSKSTNVGRYNKDGTGIPHKGQLPPKIPKSDWGKFLKGAGRLPSILGFLDALGFISDQDSVMSHLEPVYDKCGKIIGYVTS